MVWRCLFVQPFWLETVCRHLGAPGQPHIVQVCQGDQTIGIAPLAVDGTTAYFLGNHEVCDYQDIIGLPDRQQEVLAAVVDHLQRQGVTRLDLRTLHPHAEVLDALKVLAPEQTETALQPDDVTFEMALPDTWDGYLMQLKSKQRHEVRRKIRRLEDNGSYSLRAITEIDGLDPAAAVFLDLFQRNRQDKAQFMTETMGAYFKDLMHALAQQHMLCLCLLDVNQQPVAAVLCLDYRGVRYLYNSGYDAQYDYLSVGVLSNVLCIKQAIETGCRRYDFLKGSEVYKKRIGGTQVPLHRWVMEI